MKTKFTKRMLSILLAVLMVVSMMPTTVFAATSTDGNLSTLKTAIDNYETKMNSGKVYTNLKDAYEAYLPAVKAYDAKYYGYTDSDLATLAKDLNTAVNKMAEYSFDTAFTSVAPGGFEKDNGTYAEDTGYKNLLFNKLNTNVNGTDMVEVNHKNVKIQLLQSKTVLFYDGVNDPMFPVMVLGQKDTSKDRSLFQLYPIQTTYQNGEYTSNPEKSADFVMSEKWKGNTSGSQSYDKDWFSTRNGGSTVEIDSTVNSKLTFQRKYNVKGYYNYWWANAGGLLKYSGTPTEAMQKYTVKWFKNTGASQGDRYIFDAPTPTYVINKKNIKSRVETIVKLGGNTIQGYRNGGLSTIFENVDKLTINYSNATQNYDANADTLMSTLNAAYSALATPATSFPAATDLSGYEAIRTAMDRTATVSTNGKSYTIRQLGDSIMADDSYVACFSGFGAFKTAFKTAADKMADVKENDYEDNANCETAATNLTTAFNELTENHSYGTPTTVPGTCTAAGYQLFTCEICGKENKVTGSIDPNNHNYDGVNFEPEYETAKYNSNFMYTHAKACNNAPAENSHKLVDECSFDFDAWVDIVEEDGSVVNQKVTCSVCGGTAVRIKPAATYTVNFYIKDAGQSDEQYVLLDTIDNIAKDETPSLDSALIPAFDNDNHYSYSWVKDLAPATADADYYIIRTVEKHNLTSSKLDASCTESGKIIYICSSCGFSKTEDDPSAPAKGHTFNYENLNNGKHNKVCSVCKYTEYNESCAFGAAETIAPTCTDNGYDKSVCQYCSYELREKFVPAKGHTKDTPVETHRVPATCLDTGYYVLTTNCSVCGDFIEDETIVLDALGHNVTTTNYEATCTEDAYFTEKCENYGHVATEHDNNKYNIPNGFEYSYYTGSDSDYPYIERTGVETYRAPYTVSIKNQQVQKLVLTFDYSIDNGNNAYVKILNADGTEAFSARKSNGTNQTAEINGSYFLAQVIDPGNSKAGKIEIKSIKVYVQTPNGITKTTATGHNYSYTDNNDCSNGVLGTHSYRCVNSNSTGFTCDVQGTEQHNYDLNRSGNNIVVTCNGCSLNKVLHTTANTVTLTQNNLFDTDAFFNTYNVNDVKDENNITSNGQVCFRRTDGKAVVVGSGDNYSKHSRANDYVVHVQGGKTYQLDFDASTIYGDLMVFFKAADGVTSDSAYFSWPGIRKTGTTIGKNTLEFTVPGTDIKQLHIRIGTNSAAGTNVYCVFSNFALHEKDDPNYRMIKDIPMGSAINDYFTDFCTKDVCHYVYKNSTIIATDGAMATGTTFNRNCNVVKSANHDIYKEFSNGTIAHYYCLTCGYNYDKSVSLNMVYRESFDNASVSGSTFTSSNGNGTLANADTGSIVAYAGGQDKGTRYSNVRHNVLKLSANGTKPGNYLKLDTNPLQDPSVAATAKSEGITISFWRHLEQNGATANLTADSNDNTGYKWRNALTFQQDGNPANRYYIEVNGVQSRCAQEGSNYADLIPEYNDKTTKGTPNYTGDWVNIVVTIDPNDKVNGGTIYINGVPRDYNLTKCKFNGTYALSDSFTRGDIAAELIDFLTKSDTGFYFNNGAPHEGNDFDMFYDDIRIYTGVMTQLQINEMYGAEDSDTPSTNSITHDPTNVTVYTLKAGTYTAANGSGETYVAQAGKTVGEEFINYYGVDIATQVSNIEYYSFGTGMVIEKSTNGHEWTKVGDSKGHFAYQNEDLFGGKYTEVLSEPLTYAKQGASGGGYLLWAPHVMYNLTLNKWVIYESTSSWGSQFSTIFYCTSDTVYRDYAYQGMIHKTDSSSKCNAIDSDVYYGRDANGIIDKSTLYLAYGSYCWNGSNIAIWGRELTATGENKPGVDSVWNESVDYPCIKADGTSSEGIYVYYYDGYYYMFTTYGGNDNNYTEVYFRSENPNGPFTRYDGVQATAGTGMFFQSSYKNPVEAYTYWSNGHNSVYTVYNDKNEPVLVNAAHSRALTDGTVQSDEGQIITNQTDIRGNLMISNMIATTKSGWMVMFPLQYNGTDTTKLHLTAKDVVGTYDVINNTKSTSNSVASAITMEIIACDDQHIYIEDKLFALEYDAEKNVTYIVGDTIEGTFAKHDDTIEFSFFNKSTLQHTWGYQTSKSSNVGHLFEVERYIPANGDTNGYLDHCCSRVGCDAVDLKNRAWDPHPSEWENYNNALTLSKSYLQQTAKYSETSRDAYSAEISSITNGVDLNDKTKSADFIDAKTSAIESAFELLEIASYTVKLYVLSDINNKDDNNYITYNKNHLYGEVVPLSVNEGILPYKWTKAVKEGDQYLAGATDSVSLVVAEDITVYAFYNEQSKDESVTQHKITVLNKYNKPASYIYVEDNTEITFQGSTISYNDKQFTVDKLPFYDITEYKVNDEIIGSSYTVTSDIEIKPVYTPLQSIVITLGTDTIKFKNDDASKREKSVRWDDRIIVTSDSEMMWYADGVPVAKGNTYTFRASKSVRITAQPVEQATETPKSIVSFSVFDKENNKAIIAVSNYQSDNYKIVEQGIIFGTSKNANAQFDRQLIIDKGKKFVANKTTDTGDQFSFSLSFDANTTVRKLCIVSYVKYEGVAEPVYSEEVTYVDIY